MQRHPQMPDGFQARTAVQHESGTRRRAPGPAYVLTATARTRCTTSEVAEGGPQAGDANTDANASAPRTTPRPPSLAIPILRVSLPLLPLPRALTRAVFFLERPLDVLIAEHDRRAPHAPHADGATRTDYGRRAGARARAPTLAGAQPKSGIWRAAPHRRARRYARALGLRDLEGDNGRRAATQKVRAVASTREWKRAGSLVRIWAHWRRRDGRRHVKSDRRGWRHGLGRERRALTLIRWRCGGDRLLEGVREVGGVNVIRQVSVGALDRVRFGEISEGSRKDRR